MSRRFTKCNWRPSTFLSPTKFSSSLQELQASSTLQTLEIPWELVVVETYLKRCHYREGRAQECCQMEEIHQFIFRRMKTQMGPTLVVKCFDGQFWHDVNQLFDKLFWSAIDVRGTLSALIFNWNDTVPTGKLFYSIPNSVFQSVICCCSWLKRNWGQ